MKQLAVLLVALSWGCETQTPPSPALEELELPGGEQFLFDPPVVSQGTTVRFLLDSRRSSLDFDATSLVLSGAGIELQSFAVLDGFRAAGELVVAPDATLGPRDATLTAGDREWNLTDALLVIDQRFLVLPDNARMGEVITVELEGHNTHWDPSLTWASFGRDVDTISVDVRDPTHLSARIAIHSDAQPGFRDITVEQGSDVLTLYGGFTVDRAVITASWDPPIVHQGEEIQFVIQGVNTRFSDDFTEDQIQFWNGISPVVDLQIQEFERTGPAEIRGRAIVSSAARPGKRNVFLDDEEDLLIGEAFEILPTPIEPLDAALALTFDVRRELNPLTGDIEDSIRAFAFFIIPTTPPCGPPRIPSEGPIPFDINGVFPSPPDPEVIDCPEPLLVDAGEFVWFEGPTNTVTLHRDTIPTTGQPYYRGRDLTLADYHFGDTYNLRVQGTEGGIPPFFVEDAQPTVPVDYRFSQPNFGGLVHSRYDPFEMVWNPAGVYPTGMFVITLGGTLEATGESGYVGVIPFDDGAHSFGVNSLSQLRAGQASFRAFSRVEGRVFQLPFNGRNTQSDSVLSTSAVVILE